LAMILTNKQSKLLLEELYQEKVTRRQRRLVTRNVTMAIFMLDVGLRTTEVVNLTVGDLFIAGKPLGILNLVRGIPQGHRCRTIPLNERIRIFINQMNELWWKPDAEKPGNFAFYDESPLKHLTDTQFRRIIKKAGIDALEYPVRPNLLRRTCAARLLKQTNHRTVWELLDYKTDQDSFYR